MIRRSQPAKRLNRYGRSFTEKMTDGLAALTGSRGFRNARCLVVLSSGRVGTDTLAHVLDLSPEIRAYHEPRPNFLVEQLEVYQYGRRDPERFRRIFVEGRARRLASARMAGKIYAETSMRLTFFAPLIADLLPGAQFLHLHRHPGDVVRSGMRRGWYDQHEADAWRLRPTEDDPLWDEWQTWDAFTKTCWYWNEYNQFALEFCRQLEPGRSMSLRSDDLFDLSSGGARRVFEFLGVPMPAEEAIAEQLAMRHNAQNVNDFPRFEKWTDQQKSTLGRLAGSTMQALGYTLDSTVPISMREGAEHS